MLLLIHEYSLVTSPDLEDQACAVRLEGSSSLMASCNGGNAGGALKSCSARPGVGHRGLQGVSEDERREVVPRQRGCRNSVVSGFSAAFRQPHSQVQRRLSGGRGLVAEHLQVPSNAQQADAGPDRWLAYRLYPAVINGET